MTAGQTAPTAEREQRATYERELAKRLAALLVAGWRRRHGPEADVQHRDTARPPAPNEELPPAA